MFYYFSAASIYYAVIKSIFIVLQSRRPESDITMNQITPGCLQLRQCVLRIKIVVCALMFSVLVLSVNGPFRQGLFVPPLPSSVLFFTFVVLHYHCKLSQLFFSFPLPLSLSWSHPFCPHLFFVFCNSSLLFNSTIGHKLHCGSDALASTMDTALSKYAVPSPDCMQGRLQCRKSRVFKKVAGVTVAAKPSDVPQNNSRCCLRTYRNKSDNTVMFTEPCSFYHLYKGTHFVILYGYPFRNMLFTKGQR